MFNGCVKSQQLNIGGRLLAEIKFGSGVANHHTSKLNYHHHTSKLNSPPNLCLGNMDIFQVGLVASGALFCEHITGK